MQTVLAVTLILFVVAMFGVSLWARSRVETAEDFLVAGRRLPFALAFPALFATWFGAGTLLTATEAVRGGGLRMAALEPYGTGLCLVVVGIFFARRLWNMRLLTVIDFFRRRFGPRAELVGGILMVPGYFGWIAAQLIALANLLELFFGLPVSAGLVLSAAVGMGYTLLGGMWSVTLTDAVQLVFVLAGLIVLGGSTLHRLGSGDFGAGWAALIQGVPQGHWTLIPTGSAEEIVKWTTVLLIGILGNIPGQDLTQRLFAARSATVAAAASTTAGVCYLVVGTIPLLIGLAADVLGAAPESDSVLAAMASLLLHPAVTILFVLAIVSAVLSTVDSAILSPSSVIAQNVVPHFTKREYDLLAVNRGAVIGVTAISLIVAFLGEDAYSLLESAYEVGMVALLPPFVLGLFTKVGRERAALAAMIVGTGLWAPHVVLGAESFFGISPLLPPGLTATVLGFASYFAVAYTAPGSDRAEPKAQNETPENTA